MNVTDTDPVFEGDFFCEQKFWHKYNTDTHITHPMSALTGIIMIFIPLAPNIIIDKAYHFHDFIPRQFQLCKSTLALTGVGTIIFHSISADQSRSWHLNYHMCDWLPITLMGNSIIVLYLSNLFDMNETCWTILFFAICLWSSGLAVAMDSDTENHFSNSMGNWDDQKQYGTILNVLLLVPLGVTLAYACFTKVRPLQNAVPLLGAILVVLVLWISNAYFCQEVPELASFHAIYHIVISYVFIYAACIGVSLDNQWEFAPRWVHWKIHWPIYWPMVRYKEKKVEGSALFSGVAIDVPTPN
jgi:hypothetical protein